MGYSIHSATLGDSCDMYRYWGEAHPNHPLRPAQFRHRIYGYEDGQELKVLALKRADGTVDGMAVGIYPLQSGEGGVRWLGVRPGLVGSDEHLRLIDEICSFLIEKGADKAVLHATPPHYIRPGIDLRETAVVSALLTAGWKPDQTIMNMTLELDSWEMKQPVMDFGQYRIRRVIPEDSSMLEEYLLSHWTDNWCRETMNGLENDPVSVFIALCSAREHAAIVGFSAYEVNQVEGSFGPTGVDPGHQGHGLGRELLVACLDDLKMLGRQRCEIGWVGPVAFYHNLSGARIGPLFWKMTRAL